MAGALGAGLFWLGQRQKRRLRESLGWPETTGVVVWNGISKTGTGDADSGYSTTYSPEVRYQYSAAGAAFTGTRIGLVSRGYGRPQQAQEALAAYAVNQQVTVYFNPAQPQDSLLVREAAGSGWIFWLGLGMMVLAVTAAFY